MKGLAAAELLVIACLLVVAWLLKQQAEQLVDLELEVDGLRRADPWRERLPS